MVEHLGEMRFPAWRSKRWQDFHTLHIWLGKHSCCLIQANQILRWHQQTEPIQPETVVELLKGQQYKRCRLLLELPWIWLEAAETISVRTEEWPFYLRHHLQLPELPGPQQPVGWQHLKGSPPKTLLAQLSPQARELQRLLSQGRSRPLQVLPALLPWFQILSTEGDWLLKGLEQTTVLRWNAGSLQQLWSLPQWERQTEELWREDLLDQVLWQEQRLVDDHGELNRSLLQQILQTPHPEKNFQWYRPRTSLKRILRWVAVLFVLLSIAGGAFTIHHWESRRDQLRQELRQLEAHLGQRRKENPPVDLQREQARKAWEAEIAARPRVNIDYLDAISNALGESWLEQMQLTPTGANLILLLMDPVHIASILQQFEKLPFVNTVELNLQRSIELKGETVQQLHVQLQWVSKSP